MSSVTLETKRLYKEKNYFKKDLNVLSLFSGCGGMDVGFEGDFEVHQSCLNPKIHPKWIEKKVKQNWFMLPPTRFKVVFANDIRPSVAKIWSSFFVKKYGFDIRALHLESIVDRVKRYQNGEKNLFPNNIDIITGGFPCQDFSVAGKRKGFYSHKNHNGKVIDNPMEENRGKLYIWMREVIDIVQPKVFIAENVKGLISLGEVKDVIQNDFQDIGEDGYVVLEGKVLNAAEYGVPQSRERVFFIGFRKDALRVNALNALSKKIIPENYYPFPIQTHSSTYDREKRLQPFVSLEKIFKGLKEPLESSDYDQRAISRAKWYGHHCQGNKEVNLKSIGPTIRSEHHGNIEFRRLSAEHGGSYHNELQKGFPERRLTVRECCRIQTFPDSFQLVGKKRGMGVSVSEAYKLVGNAVPPLLAYHIAKRLESIWDNLFKKGKSLPKIAS